ncbi:MAG: hypothetical protein AAF515_12325 [Pseudomonadota bacterium]
MAISSLCAHTEARPYKRARVRSSRTIAAIIALGVALANGTHAEDYAAIASGNWGDSATWQPAGIPGAGDRVTGLGNHTVTVAADHTIGSGDEEVALVIDGSGGVTLAPGARLVVAGHIDQKGWRNVVQLGAGAAIRFDPAADAQFEWRQNNAGQRILFAGAANNRAVIGLTDTAAGGWHVASVGFRDSVFGGSYGRIEDALDPTSGRGWRMYLADDAVYSSLVADHFEFLRCGEISVFGLSAGDNTTVQLDALTFRDQQTGDVGYALPAFWLDGYAGETATPIAKSEPNFVTNLVSDTGVALRYVSGYVLDNHVLDSKPSGFGQLRNGNNGGNARSSNNQFVAIKRGGNALNLISDEVDTAYFYAQADNPHGLSTAELRGDALIRNYWFESDYADQTDNGDAILTNGPQNYVSRFGAEPILVRVEHSGTIGDRNGSDWHPTLVTFNESTGVRMDVRHSYARISEDSQAIAVDENGVTPTGTGLSFYANVVVSDNPVDFGYGIGSPSERQSIEDNVFLSSDYNVYKNLADNGEGKFKVHETFIRNGDKNSVRRDPGYYDPSRDIATWDASLGGPGTAEHAIEQMKRRNDDSGFDPSYTVANLVRFVAQGHATTHTNMVAGDGFNIGPALYGAPEEEAPEPMPGMTIELEDEPRAWGIAARKRTTDMGFIMYSEESVFSRFRSGKPFGRNLAHFVAVVEDKGRWYYDDRKKLRQFTPASGDVLIARVDFGADTVEMLEGIFDSLEGITLGYYSGDLTLTPEQWKSTKNPIGAFDLNGTSFTPWQENAAPMPAEAQLVNGALEAGLADGEMAIGMLDGWHSTNPLEIWASGHQGVTSKDGGNFIDLDYEGGDAVPDRIWQDVQTVAGQKYVLTFDMRANGATPPQGDGQAVCVKWNGRRTRNTCYNPTNDSGWKRWRIVVTGTGGLDQIQLRERIRDDANDGEGPFIDNIKFAPR